MGHLGWNIQSILSGVPQLFILIPDLFTPGMIIRISFILIIKLVPNNLEHIPASSEYFPAINSSNFMHQETIPPFLFCPPKLDILFFQVKQVDAILAGKEIASDFSEIPLDACVLNDTTF
jgi:hypothetical protein